MGKRLTKADRETLIGLVDRYSPMQIASEALKVPPKKPGRPPNDWLITMHNAIVIYVAVEARLDGKKGELGRAYEQTAKVLRWETSPFDPEFSTNKIGKLHAMVRKQLADRGEDGQILAQFCEEEQRRQARSTRVIGGRDSPKAVCLISEDEIKRPRHYEK